MLIIQMSLILLHNTLDFDFVFVYENQLLSICMEEDFRRGRDNAENKMPLLALLQLGNANSCC